VPRNFVTGLRAVPPLPNVVCGGGTLHALSAGASLRQPPIRTTTDSRFLRQRTRTQPHWRRCAVGTSRAPVYALFGENSDARFGATTLARGALLRSRACYYAAYRAYLRLVFDGLTSRHAYLISRIAATGASSYYRAGGTPAALSSVGPSSYRR